MLAGKTFGLTADGDLEACFCHRVAKVIKNKDLSTTRGRCQMKKRSQGATLNWEISQYFKISPFGRNDISRFF